MSEPERNAGSEGDCDQHTFLFLCVSSGCLLAVTWRCRLHWASLSSLPVWPHPQP